MKPFTFLLFAFHISTQALPAQQPALTTDALWKQQADSLKALEDYAAAETHLLKTLTSIAQDKGKEDLDYASCLYALVEVYNQTGDLQRSESCLLEVKAIRLKKLGPEHADYAGAVFDLGLLYHKTWRYAEAEACYKEAIAIREKLPGDESTLFAASLYRLSFLYWEMGRNQEAEKALTKVLAIKEKKPGKDNAEYAIYLNQMGNVVSDQGRLEEAESFYVEARMLREKHLGKDHPYYANTTDNLGVLYTDMGRYAEAEKLLEEAKAIREKTPGKMSEAYTKSLNNLAVLYRTTGRLNEAAGTMQQVLSIKDSLSGRENPDYANSLINIGIIYRDLGRYGESEQMLLQANAIWENIFGRDNPVYAEFEVILGGLYTETGRYEEAEKMYDQALAVLEKIMSRDNLLPAKIMRDRARLYAKTGRHELAEPLLIASDDIQKGLLSRGVRFLSEKELASYTAVFMQNSYYFLQYASTRSRSQAALIQACYDHALFSKGFLLNAVNRTKKLALSDTLTAKTYELLVLNSRLLADEYALPPAEQKGTDSLEAKVNELEKELARRVAGFSDANRQVSWQDVQQNLKPDEAALEFVHFHCYDQNSRITDSVVYAAMLLRPGWKAPRWFTLFEQQELRRLFSGANNSTSLNHNYANNKQRSRAEKSEGIVVGIGESAGLYQLIWKALEKETTGVKTLYYAPSGLLHRLNHAAIPINADSVLADRFRLVQVGSTRQLALRGQNLATDPAFVPSMDQPATAALFGGIRYDLDSTAIRQSPATLNAPTGTRSSQSIVFFDNNVRRTGWDYLPFTEKEVSDVEKYLKATNVEVDAFKGYEATEEAFKSIGSNKPSPRTIHLATHGFFFPDPKGASGIDESVFKSADNPMMRSGLLLAGANHAWQTGKPFRPDMDDGILTAYEISQMNLSNTELVVLSACETGLGDIQGNEGVYGLQRAFKIAGAKYLVMSLWQVPDKETSEFMAAFYRKWLEDRMEIPDAFRAAQKEMREQGLAPYQWAGFVLVE